MHHPDEAQYFFHGSAFALGGRITRPFCEVLEVQAATSLPSVGGYGSARAENYRYRDLISFDRAYSVVTGSSDEGIHDTVVFVAVEGLNIMNMVTADRVVARLTTSRRTAAEPQQTASLLPVGSYFVNLRIAGVPVHPKLHDLLCRRGNLSDLAREYPDDPFIDGGGNRFDLPQEVPAVAGTAPYLRFEDWHLVTSIFHPLDVKHPAFEVLPGGAIHIEGFGRIILGQYLITRGSRTLSMIVCHFGCGYGGTLAIGGGHGNGNPP